MAAGTRTRRIIEVNFISGSPVVARALWNLDVEDLGGKLRTVESGVVETNLGAWSTVQNLTLGSVRSTLLSLVAAIGNHDATA